MHQRQVLAQSPGKLEEAIHISAEGGLIYFAENFLTAEHELLTNNSHYLPSTVWRLLLAELDVNGEASQGGISLNETADGLIKISWITTSDELRLGKNFRTGRKLHLTAPRQQLDLV